MLYLFVFLGGVVVGWFISGLAFVKTAVFGKFSLEPYDEDDTGFYNFKIEVEHKENLLYRDYIILKKDNSQK